MSRNSLKDTLRELDAALEQDDLELDDESRALLGKVQDDIGEVLHTESAWPLQPARTGVQAAIERFEAEHPELVAVLNRAAELLASIGV